MKRTIETNCGYYLLSKSDAYYLLATCDQNICSKCHQFKWIVNITYKRFDKKNFNNIEIALCDKCIKNTEYDSKNHHCPFHNTHVLEEAKICESCIDKLKLKTEELYKKVIIYKDIVMEDTFIDF